MTERVTVQLFKVGGKWYTEERWRIPAEVPDSSPQRGDYIRKPLGPFDMRHSPDFRRIDGGPVLVESQEPWGFPHLFPTATLKEEVEELIRRASAEIEDDTKNRQLILEGLLRDLKAAVRRVR